MRPITKQEEQRAFQYIKDKLIPKVVEAYNGNPNTERKFTADEIRKVLKKESDRPMGSHTGGHVIEYFARLKQPNSNLSFLFCFIITRADENSEHPGRIMVHCKFPIAGICSDHLQESFEIDPERERRSSITKVEEARGLQYIREKVVPNTAIRWNNAVNRSKLQNKDQYKITVEQINKSLVKKSHYVHTPGDRTRYDHILYQSTPQTTFALKGPFQFSLSKDRFVGELTVAVCLPGSENWVKYYINVEIDTVHDDTALPIRRNIHIKEALNVPDDPLDIHRFSRREEDYAVSFIKRQLIPYEVDKKNKMVQFSSSWKFPPRKNRAISFRVDDVLRNLKKVKEVPGKHGIQLYYRAQSQNQDYYFAIFKDGEGDTMVRNINNGQAFQVGRPIPPFDEKTLTESMLTEGDVKNPMPITKAEEAAAVDYIKKVMIPEALKHYNQYEGNHLYEPISDDTLRRLLKKIDVHHEYGRPSLTVVYEAGVPSKFGSDPIWIKDFRFYISKNENNEMFIRWKHPFNFSAGTYHKDQHGYYTHQPLVRENEDRGRRTISKKEEAELLQNIRNHVIPVTVEIWNDYVKRHKREWKGLQITQEQISKNLVKHDHAIHAVNDKTTTDVIYYKSMIKPPRFVFNFEGHKNINSGKMMVMITFPNGSSNYVSPTTVIGDLRENSERTQIPVPERCKMTKRDIAEALQFIRQVAVPHLVNFYNRKIDFAPEMKVEDVLGNLRMVEKKQMSRNVLTVKSNIEKGQMLTAPYEAVTFKSEGEKIITFTVSKDSVGKMVLHIGMNQIHSAPTEIPDPPMLFEAIDHTEPSGETGLPNINAMEEKEALQYIRQYMVPLVLKYHNGVNPSHSQVSEEEFQKDLRLAGRYPSRNKENPSITFVSVPRGLYFAFTVHKQIQPNVADYGKLYVRFRTPDTFSPHDYYIGTPPSPLNEGIKVVRAGAPRIINKMEENQALQYIRNTLIPAAFRSYNDHVMGENRIRDEDDIRKAMRKLDVEYIPKNFEEHIYYIASVPTVGGKKRQSFEFWTRKGNRPGFTNRIRCGVKIVGYDVAGEFYIGDPTYMN